MRITGPTRLHNAILSMNDLRAGATVVLAAMLATGQSSIYGVEQIDRGYEHIDTRLNRSAHLLSGLKIRLFKRRI